MSSNIKSNRPEEDSKASRKDQRLTSIYKTAAKIIEREGYDATSLSDIAKAVGLTKAGLYHYFPSKEDLLFGIMTFGMDKVFEEVIEPTQRITDPRERIRAIVINQALLIIECGQPVTIVGTEMQKLSPAQHRLVVENRREYFEYVRDTIQEIRLAGYGGMLDDSITANSVFAILLSLANWYRPGGRLTQQQVIDQIVELTVGRIIGLSVSDTSQKVERLAHSG